MGVQDWSQRVSGRQDHTLIRTTWLYVCIYLNPNLPLSRLVLYSFVYMHICVYISVWICAWDTGTCEGQKKALYSLELELPALWATPVSAGNWTQIFHKRGTTGPSLLPLKPNLVSILQKWNWGVSGIPSFSSCPCMDTLYNSSGFLPSLISLAGLWKRGVKCWSCWSPGLYASKLQEHSYAARRKGALSANNLQQVSFRWRGRTGQFCTAAWDAFISGMFFYLSTLASTGFSLPVLDKAEKYVLGLFSSWCLNLGKFSWTSACVFFRLTWISKPCLMEKQSSLPLGALLSCQSSV